MLHDLNKLETDLWEAADHLRANANLPYNEYFMPVLGVIFLRHAANRFDAVTRQIAEDQGAGRMPKRKVTKADYIRRRALWLPEPARFENILALPKGTDLGKALNDAMTKIEEDFEPLAGVLPKDYARFSNDVIEELLKVFNRESIRGAVGDVFGRIYEYFLMKFADVEAHDKGEFFTPPSLVQTIVNVIEPEHGTNSTTSPQTSRRRNGPSSGNGGTRTSSHPTDLDRRLLAKLVGQFDDARKAAVEQLKQAGYFHKQVAWLQDRFPDAKLVPVPGLVKVVDTREIEAADWSLTPGRYVGVAPPEADEDFDFEEAIRDIHVELAGLNEEAAELAKRIQENFEELGI